MTEPRTTKTETEALAEQIRPELREVHTSPSGAPIIAAQNNDGSTTIQNLNDWAETVADDTPMRSMGQTVLHDPMDWANFTVDQSHVLGIGDEALAPVGVTAAYVDVTDKKHQATAVLNGTRGDLPGWSDHRAVLSMPEDPSWSQWKERLQGWWTQDQLGEFVEDHLYEFMDPDGLGMLDLATNFQSTSKLQFARQVRLQDGQVQLEYKEDVEAGIGAAKIPVPELVHVQIPFWVGAAPTPMALRFRWRRDGQQIVLGLRATNLEQTIREALDLHLAPALAVLDVANIPHYRANPPASRN